MDLLFRMIAENFRLRMKIIELRQKLIDQQNYTLQLDRRENADLQHDPN